MVTLKEKLWMVQKQKGFLTDFPSSPLVRSIRAARPVPLAKVRRASLKAKSCHVREGQRGWRTRAEQKKGPEGRGPNPDG
ncbi:hypothetical protein Tco_0589585, partial [Tanacetum coccineum]